MTEATEKDLITEIADVLRAGAKGLKKAAKKLDSAETRDKVDEVLNFVDEVMIDLEDRAATVTERFEDFIASKR